MSSENDLVVGMGNYDKVCISGYLCNLCQKKDLVVGLGVPNIFFLCVLCGEGKHENLPYLTIIHFLEIEMLLECNLIK